MKSIILVSFALLATSLAFKQPRLGLFHTERVIGGTNAEKNEFPHQISLRYYGQHICGGSIVNERWIVTAGHCLRGFDTSVMAVRVGILNVNEAGVEHKIEKAVIHPKYGSGVMPNDIALIKVRGNIEFNVAVQPINLPVAGAQASGDVIISGWGSISTSFEPIYPDHLQKATLSILTFDECANALSSLLGSYEPLDDVSNICTGPLDKSTGACSGDSGGPLIQGKTLVGIVSWGIIPCGGRGAPSVYTRVSSFLDFCNENINQ